LHSSESSVGTVILKPFDATLRGSRGDFAHWLEWLHCAYTGFEPTLALACECKVRR